ncbi:MAG: DNA polymerase III subunit beta [Dehalococcoidia bacterium]
MPKNKEKKEPGSGTPPERQAQVLEVGVAALRDVLDLVGPAVPRKTALPVVQHVRLGDGQVVATDLDVAVAVALPQAEGAMLLPPREALEFLGYAPGHLSARITSENDTVSIAVGGMQSHFKVPDPEEFPPVPFALPDQMEHQGVLEGDALVRALTAVLPSAATEENRPVLRGVCLTLGDKVQVVAGDGYRLAWEGVPGRLPGEGHILLPAPAVRLLAHLWKRAASPDLSAASNPAQVALAKRLIRLEWEKEKLQMRFGRVALLCKLIQGTFPEYNQLIPTEHMASVTVDAGDMLRALQQVKGRAREGAGIVRLKWEGDSLQVSSRAEDVGDTTVPLRAHSNAPGKTGMNISYLLEYFKGKEGSVTMALAGTEGAPITFTHRGTPHIIIMPMFAKED